MFKSYSNRPVYAPQLWQTHSTVTSPTNEVYAEIEFAFVHMAANSSILCLIGVLICLEWRAADNQRDNQRGSSAEAISQTHNQTIDASWKNWEC